MILEAKSPKTKTFIINEKKIFESLLEILIISETIVFENLVFHQYICKYIYTYVCKKFWSTVLDCNVCFKYWI